MNEDAVVTQLNQVRDAINLDQSMWQIGPAESGRVGLVRSRQVNDYVWAEASVELDDDPSGPGFLVRGVVVDCYDPVRLQVVRCPSPTEAARAAVAVLRWVSRTASAVAAAAEMSDQAPKQNQ